MVNADGAGFSSIKDPIYYGSILQNGDEERELPVLDGREFGPGFLGRRRRSMSWPPHVPPPPPAAAGDEGSIRHVLVGGFSNSMRNLTYGGRTNVSVRSLGGRTTIPNQSMNLVKNLVGAGVLSLPSGIAAFGNAPSAAVPAAIYTVLMAAIFGYYFLLIGKTCQLLDSATYREAWEESQSSNNGTAATNSPRARRAAATLVATINMLKPALGNLAYSMILADTFQSLFATLGVPCTRTLALVVVTLVALLPLTLMKNLQALAPFSIMGTVGILIATAVLGIRYFDGSYDPARSGRFVDDLPERLRPSFGDVGIRGAWTPHVMVLVAMLFEAFVAHYNAPRMLTELKHNTIPRFRAVVTCAFGLSGIIYVLFSSFGYLTFGANCDGYILNNYSTNDELATTCRVVIAFMIILTYPVVFFGTRDGLLDVLHISMEQETANLMNVLSIALLTVLTVIAVFVHDLGMVSAVGGGTLSTFVVFVFPSFMYRAAVYQEYDDGAPPAHVVREVWFAMILMCVGIAMGAIGVWMAIV